MGGRILRNILLFMVFAVLIATVWRVFSSDGNDDPISLNELVAQINAGQISEIRVDSNTLYVTRENGSQVVARKGAEQGLAETLTDLGADPARLQQVSIEVERPSQWGGDFQPARWFFPAVDLWWVPLLHAATGPRVQ